MNEKSTYSRASYEGRHLARHTLREKKAPRKINTLAVKFVASILALGVLWVVKSFSPSASEALGRFIDENINGGVNYRAVFSAVGEFATGEGDITKVFSEFSAGTEEVQSENGAEKELQEVGGAGGGAMFMHIPYAYSAPGKNAHVVRMGAVSNATSKSSSEIPVPIEETDVEDDESNPPEAVSYEYPELNFEYAAPLEGSVTSGFGYRIHPITKKRSFHYGIDIGATTDTDIVSFADGTVELTGYNSVYGNYLFIRHKNGILTFYGHCSKIIATEGQLVKLGDTVAKVGSTGWSTGPHLHFEVRSGETVLDPSHYVGG